MNLSNTIIQMLEQTAFQTIVSKKKKLAKDLLNPDTFKGRFELSKRNGLSEEFLGKLTKAIVKLKTNKERSARNLRDAKAKYKARFDYDPPDSIDADAMHRWINSKMTLGPAKRGQGPQNYADAVAWIKKKEAAKK